MTDHIREDIETDNIDDGYKPITLAEIEAALSRVSAYVEAIGDAPVPDETPEAKSIP